MQNLNKVYEQNLVYTGMTTSDQMKADAKRDVFRS